MVGVPRTMNLADKTRLYTITTLILSKQKGTRVYSFPYFGFTMTIPPHNMKVFPYMKRQKVLRVSWYPPGMNTSSPQTHSVLLRVSDTQGHLKLNSWFQKNRGSKHPGIAAIMITENPSTRVPGGKASIESMTRSLAHLLGIRIIRVDATNPLLFTNMPDNVLHKIASMLPDKNAIRLSSTSKAMNPVRDQVRTREIKKWKPNDMNWLVRRLKYIDYYPMNAGILQSKLSNHQILNLIKLGKNYNTNNGFQKFKNSAEMYLDNPLFWAEQMLNFENSDSNNNRH
jgi:hypothetical protein